MAVTDTMERVYRSPMRKLMRFFEKSRDQWKAKHHALKAKLKREQNQRRAMEKSRSAWRAKAEAAEQRAHELEVELQQTQKSGTGVAAR